MHHGGGAMTKIVFTVLLVMAFACDVFAFAGRVPYSMV
jgi:hypothetical protein